MKTLPILLSTPMVQAILDGRKKQTRRNVGIKTSHFASIELRDGKFIPFVRGGGAQLWPQPEIKPKYQVGYIMWVRETWIPSSGYGTINRFIYKADDDIPHGARWKPSIHMPKEAARIFLEVTDVRVERLQDISEEDAIAEGVEQHSDYGTTGYRHYGRPNEALTDIDAKWSFETLWESINGKESWNENPFVWVYDFKKVKKPKDFLK